MKKLILAVLMVVIISSFVGCINEETPRKSEDYPLDSFVEFTNGEIRSTIWEPIKFTSDFLHPITKKFSNIEVGGYEHFHMLMPKDLDTLDYNVWIIPFYALVTNQYTYNHLKSYIVKVDSSVSNAGLRKEKTETFDIKDIKDITKQMNDPNYQGDLWLLVDLRSDDKQSAFEGFMNTSESDLYPEKTTGLLGYILYVENPKLSGPDLFIKINGEVVASIAQDDVGNVVISRFVQNGEQP